MKNRLTSHLGFVAMAFLLTTAVTVNATTEDMSKAKVVRIKGSARFTTGTGTWQPLKVGDVLVSGAVIQTAADSRVDVVLGDPKAVAGSAAKVGLPFGSATPGAGGGGPSSVDQNFIRLMENTVMSIDKLAATDTGADIVTDTQLDLRAGRVFGTVKKLSAGSRYEVKIPNGVAGVRGTIYMLSAQGDCMVWEGSMGVALVMGKAGNSGNSGNSGQADPSTSDEVIKRVINAKQKYDPRTDVITDLSGQDQSEMIANTSASQQNRKGSNPWGPTPPNGKDNPYVSPTSGNAGKK